MTTYSYSHLGLRLRCDRAVPHLSPEPDHSADVEIISADFPAYLDQLPWHEVLVGVWRAPAAQDWSGAPGSWLRTRYVDGPHWAEFVIDPPGRTVWIRSHGAPWPDLCELLLAPLFSCVLSHRGVTCLHAGVLAIEDRVVAIIGDKEAGKSTLSLSLVRCGASVISDDVAVLGNVGQRCAVVVGLPRLRIHEHSAALVHTPYEALDSVWVHQGRGPVKRYVQTPPVSSSEPLPLDALYFLNARAESDTDPRIDVVPAARGLPRLMTNRHMVTMLDRTSDRTDFGRLAGLAGQVALREITRPDNLDALDRTVDMIVADIESLPTREPSARSR